MSSMINVCQVLFDSADRQGTIKHVVDTDYRLFGLPSQIRVPPVCTLCVRCCFEVEDLNVQKYPWNTTFGVKTLCRLNFLEGSRGRGGGQGVLLSCRTCSHPEGGT